MWSARRRPRWGVRWRLDVANLFATDVRLDLTERAIYGQALFGGGTSGDMRSVSLPHIHVRGTARGIVFLAGRGDAAATTWISRGDEVAATPRP